MEMFFSIYLIYLDKKEVLLILGKDLELHLPKVYDNH